MAWISASATVEDFVSIKSLRPIHPTLCAPILMRFAMGQAFSNGCTTSRFMTATSVSSVATKSTFWRFAFTPPAVSRCGETTLGRKAALYGVDIDQRCKKLENESVKVFIGDQGGSRVLEAFQSRSPNDRYPHRRWGAPNIPTNRNLRGDAFAFATGWCLPAKI